MKEEVEKETKKTEKAVKNKPKESYGARSFGYIISIAVNIVLIYVFNNLLNWQIDFLKESFVAPLWIFNLSFAATILANIFFLIYDGKWFRSLCQVVLNVISAATIYTLYLVFPFSVSDEAAKNIRFVLIVLLVCTGIAIVVESVKFVYYLVKLTEGTDEK